MSLRALVDVFERSEATKTARLVLLALADHAHDDGSNAWPAVPTLATKARCDERTVQRALRDLERRCEIVRTGTTSRGVAIWHLTVVSPLAYLAEAEPGRGDKMSPELSSRTVQGSGGKPPPEYGPTERRPAGGALPPPLPALGSAEHRAAVWAGWSRRHADVTNPEALEYRLDDLNFPASEWPALVAAHLRQRRTA